MEDLIIFRMFLTFPFIGLLIPDSGILLFKTDGKMPVTHIIIEVSLLLSIIICSVGINYYKRKSDHIDLAKF